MSVCERACLRPSNRDPIFAHGAPDRGGREWQMFLQKAGPCVRRVDLGLNPVNSARAGLFNLFTGQCQHEIWTVAEMQSGDSAPAHPQSVLFFVRMDEKHGGLFASKDGDLADLLINPRGR